MATPALAGSHDTSRCDGGDLCKLGGHGLGLPDVCGVDCEFGLCDGREGDVCFCVAGLDCGGWECTVIISVLNEQEEQGRREILRGND